MATRQGALNALTGAATPMALAKEKYGASAWQRMSAAERKTAIDAHQEDYKARVRSPGRGTGAAARTRSPLAPMRPTVRSPARSPGRADGGRRTPGGDSGASVAGSLSDMNTLLGTMQSTNALSDGQAGQLQALQEAVLSSMTVAEKEMDKFHAQTKAQLVRFSADKAHLVAEKEQAVAAKLTAEEDVRNLRAALSEMAQAGAGGRTGAAADELRAGVVQSQLEHTLSALAQAQASETQTRSQMSLTRRELDEAQLLRASVDAKLEAETGAGAALREELAAMRRENEAMRLGFAARLEEMTASQGRLRAQQDELGRLARDG